MQKTRYPIINCRMSDGSTVKIEHRPYLDSTTSLARDYAKAGYPDRYVVFTELQSTSAITETKLSDAEFERGVFVSCILRPAFFPAQAGLLGPLSTVALLSALEEHTTKSLGIGWVNDIFCEGEKIGGCAIEGKLDSYSTYEYLIVSFAARTDDTNFPPRLTDMIRKVFESENESIGMLVAKNILNKFFAAYTSLKTPGKYMDIYKRRFILTGKKIKYLRDGKKKVCRVIDVDKDTCTLVAEVAGGEKIKITSPSAVIIPKTVRLDKKSSLSKNSD